VKHVRVHHNYSRATHPYSPASFAWIGTTATRDIESKDEHAMYNYLLHVEINAQYQTILIYYRSIIYSNIYIYIHIYIYIIKYTLHAKLADWTKGASSSWEVLSAHQNDNSLNHAKDFGLVWVIEWLFVSNL